MTNPFKFKNHQVPILTPLARGSFWRRARARFARLPPAVAPIAVTLIGGLGIVLLFGALMGREAPEPDVRETASIGNELAVTEADAAPMAGTNEASAAGDEVETAMAEPAAATASDQQPSVIETNAAEPSPRLPSETDLNTVLSVANDDQVAPDVVDGGQPEIVAVAETTDEVLALEEIQRREVEADVGPPSNEITAAISPTPGPKVAAVATKWVNMRAGPSDDAEILTVVPALANIEAESDCGWCAVTYDGRQGFIYKNFISYE